MATENKKYIPALRFPEFQNDGEWKIVLLKDFTERIKSKVGNAQLRPISISAGIGFVDQKNKFGRDISGNQYSNYIVLKKGEFAYNKGNSIKYPQGCVYQLKEFEIVACPNVFVCFRIINNSVCPDFMSAYFASNYHGKQLQQYITSGVRSNGLLNISAETFLGIKTPLPSPAEQKKIADCLSSLDKYIDATKRKLELLKEHKKGLMQRLFPAKGKTTPELRFPEFIGTKEWTPKQLGSIGETFGGLSGKSAEDFGTGQPFVIYKQVFDSSEIDFSECALVHVSENETQNKLQYRDVLVTMSSETPDEVGYTAVVTNKNIPECYLNSFCFIYRLFDNESIDAKFLIYLFSSDVYRTAVVRIAQGITRFNISKTKFKEIELVIPENEDEQRKIAETLSATDKQITEYDKKIKSLELHKKGLMQQLFPKL